MSFSQSASITRYKLYVPYVITNAIYNYFSYRASRIWNAVTLDDVAF